MLRQRAYKTKLHLTNNQERAFYQWCGAARFVYNWALNDRINKYEAGTPTNYYEQKKRFNATKDEFAEWIREIPYVITEYAFRDLDTAYKNFFRRVKKGEKSLGFPKFKSRAGSKPSFSVRDIKIKGDRARMPKMGWVRLAERDYIPTGVKVNRVTVTKRPSGWWISVQVDEEIDDPLPAAGDALGIDMGISSAAYFSDGRCYDKIDILRSNERKLARLQRELSRRQKGSNNRAKTKLKISRLHERVTEQRRNQQHYISSQAMKYSPRMIVVENLNISGMLKNGHLARSISDVGIGEILRQVKYKGGWNGIEIIEADRWYASTQTCSICGNRKEGSDKIKLNDRIYHCAACGNTMNRDLNAARNLAAISEGVITPGLPVELSTLVGTEKQEA